VSSHDYRINAEVRRFLVSRWVDVSLLQIGTTNGVVYLMGSFEPLVEDALQRVGQMQERDPAQRLLRLLLLVEKELRRLRGVRDVVFNLRNARRKGGIWRVKGPQGDVFLADGKKKQHGSGETTQGAQAQDEASDDERTDTTPGTR
jgi:hypothetical protein